MAVTSDQIVGYAALLNPQNDTDATGGSIDTSMRVIFDGFTGDQDLEILSDNAADTTQALSLILRQASGDAVTVPLTLNGVTPVLTPLTGALLGPYSRVQEARLDNVCTGIVTVRIAGGGATVLTIPPGELGALRLFQGVGVEALNTYPAYAKMFWSNISTVDALVNVNLRLTSDFAGNISIGPTVAAGAAEQIANRRTAPVGITFTAVNINVPAPTGTGAIGPGINIPTWYRFNVDQALLPQKFAFTSGVFGQAV